MHAYLSAFTGMVCSALVLTGPGLAAGMSKAESLHSDANPIIADGSSYGANPAPVISGDTLYLLASVDKAVPGENRFVMPSWQLFASRDVSSGSWTHWADFLRPEKVFKWAAPGHAYGGQIVRGPKGRYYLYASVLRNDCYDQLCPAIGVAVAKHVTGPWQDAHPAGPIFSQITPETQAAGITSLSVLQTPDGEVVIYWGGNGHLQAAKLRSDMRTLKGKVQDIPALKGYRGAPWLFQRGKSYYLAYAANTAGPKSDCTPTLNHACIAYATAETPMGPWTPGGVIMGPVSSVSAHAAIMAYHGQWFIAYHTADGKGGGHFRRSVAIDPLHWDDSQSPARIEPVHPSPAPEAVIGPQRNVAPSAQRFVSKAPLMFWDKALNDGIVRENPLPPDMWSNWDGENTPQNSMIAYLWQQPKNLNGVRIRFWSDHASGAGIGIAPPQKWHLEYCRGSDWRRVRGTSGYPTKSHAFIDVSFPPIHTRCLRAVFQASEQAGMYAGIAVEEWEALAVKPQKVVIWHKTPAAKLP